MEGPGRKKNKGRATSDPSHILLRMNRDLSSRFAADPIVKFKPVSDDDKG